MGGQERSARSALYSERGGETRWSGLTETAPHRTAVGKSSGYSTNPAIRPPCHGKGPGELKCVPNVARATLLRLCLRTHQERVSRPRHVHHLACTLTRLVRMIRRNPKRRRRRILLCAAASPERIRAHRPTPNNDQIRRSLVQKRSRHLLDAGSPSPVRFRSRDAKERPCFFVIGRKDGDGREDEAECVQLVGSTSVRYRFVHQSRLPLGRGVVFRPELRLDLEGASRRTDEMQVLSGPERRGQVFRLESRSMREVLELCVVVYLRQLER